MVEFGSVLENFNKYKINYDMNFVWNISVKKWILVRKKMLKYGTYLEYVNKPLTDIWHIHSMKYYFHAIYIYLVFLLINCAVAVLSGFFMSSAGFAFSPQ